MNLFHQSANPAVTPHGHRVYFLDGGWINFNAESDSFTYCDKMAHSLMYKILDAMRANKTLTHAQIFSKLQQQDYNF